MSQFCLVNSGSKCECFSTTGVFNAKLLFWFTNNEGLLFAAVSRDGDGAVKIILSTNVKLVS